MNIIYSYLPAQIYSSLVITLVLCVLAIIIGARVKKLKPTDPTPLWLIPIIAIVDAINNLARENIGKRWKNYAPYFLTIAIYIFFANISGVFGLINPTCYLVINAALAVNTFLMIQTTGIVTNGPWEYLKSFFAPIFLLAPINLIGEFTLPISLALRLMGNIMSGGVLNRMVVGLLGWFAIPVLPAMNIIFDLFSGLIQTLVFVLLTIIFTGMKVNEKELQEIELEKGEN